MSLSKLFQEWRTKRDFKKLGIKEILSPIRGEKRITQLEYDLSPKIFQLENPSEMETYFENAITAIYRDRPVNEFNEISTVNLNKEFKPSLDSFIEKVDDSTSELSRRNAERDLLPINVMNYTGAIFGAISTVFLSYGSCCEIATSLADSMNNQTPLLAPLTGILQTTISLAPPIFLAIPGGILGSKICSTIPNAYLKYRRPEAFEYQKYSEIKEALSHLTL